MMKTADGSRRTTRTFVLFIVLLLISQSANMLNTLWSDHVYYSLQIVSGVAAGICGLLLIRNRDEQQEEVGVHHVRTQYLLFMIGATPFLLLMPILGLRTVPALLILLLLWSRTAQLTTHHQPCSSSATDDLMRVPPKYHEGRV